MSRTQEHLATLATMLADTAAAHDAEIRELREALFAEQKARERAQRELAELRRSARMHALRKQFLRPSTWP